jgi:hypothetical protein
MLVATVGTGLLLLLLLLWLTTVLPHGGTVIMRIHRALF